MLFRGKDKLAGIDGRDAAGFLDCENIVAAWRQDASQSGSMSSSR
jgi:hypothetical protein